MTGPDTAAARPPVAEIVAVGSELLLGDSVDTNSAHLSARLAELGVNVYRHTTVGDNLERLVAVLGEACGRADIVLVTGGLGPTQDDLTRQAVACLACVPLVREPRLITHVEEHFRARGRSMPSSNLRQADLPEGAWVIEPVGTAAGFALEIDGTTVCCLPGVPREMEAMVDADVMPVLAARAGRGVTVSRLVRTAGMSESAVAEHAADLVERLEEAGNPTIAFLASRGETRVRVTARADTRWEALQLCAPVVSELVDILGGAVVGLDDEGVEHAIARQLSGAQWTLALAESITAGAAAGRLVRVPGASAWLRGGVVAYTDEAKRALADVEPSALAEHGPVSEATSAALARGIRARLGADVGLGVTGVAGPQEQGGVAPGTVCLAVVLPGGVEATQTVKLPGRARDWTLEFAASTALDYLRRELAEVVSPSV